MNGSCSPIIRVKSHDGSRSFLMIPSGAYASKHRTHAFSNGAELTCTNNDKVEADDDVQEMPLLCCCGVVQRSKRETDRSKNESGAIAGGYEEKTNVSLIAEFVDRHEIWPKQESMLSTSVTKKKMVFTAMQCAKFRSFRSEKLTSYSGRPCENI